MFAKGQHRHPIPRFQAQLVETGHEFFRAFLELSKGESSLTMNRLLVRETMGCSIDSLSKRRYGCFPWQCLSETHT